MTAAPSRCANCGDPLEPMRYGWCDRCLDAEYRKVERDARPGGITKTLDALWSESVSAEQSYEQRRAEIARRRTGITWIPPSERTVFKWDIRSEQIARANAASDARQSEPLISSYRRRG